MSPSFSSFSFLNVSSGFMPSKKKSQEKKKSIGIPINPPEKDCKDIRCAWHGRLPVRGRVFKGSVRSAKSHNTVIVEWDYHRFIPKYERYQRQKSRITAHNPPCIRARDGDKVVVAECRPVSKTKHFVVVGFQKELHSNPAKRQPKESEGELKKDGVQRHLQSKVHLPASE